MSRKRSLSSKLSRRDPTDDELDASLAEFNSAHDRVAAIMGAALVENSIVEAIKVCLDDDSDTGALFYDDKSPFGTFYARIVAAKAFGLVDERLAADLHVIRDIRNQFAHTVLCLDFENEHIAPECEKLKRFPEWEGSKGKSANRRHYQNACYTLTVHLLKAANNRLEKQTRELEKQANELKARALNELHPDLHGLSRVLAAYSGLGDLITTSLQNRSDDIPDNGGANKL